MTPGEERQTDNAPPQPFFIVGIGASAGGLEALSALLQRVTVDGAAFVVVQHLAPNQRSLLAELLGRASRLAVMPAEEGAVVHPNCVYVMPPNVEMSIVEGTLHLLPPTGGVGRVHLPIDSFFRSLASDWGAKSIGVVLSGTGTDGTFGLAAIKAAGGITFAQDPSSAKFDGMPRSALQSGHADFCLAPEAIADEILEISRHPYVLRRASTLGAEEQLRKLAALIKTAFGIDLSHYKTSTIERRLQRRLAVHRLERLEDYVRLCQSDPKELANLHRDLLINVTSFFRDPEAFDVLEAEIFPRSIARKADADSIRVWVPGCASGEEAYSIGMCLLEALDSAERNLKVQIFGTDVDPEAIQQARRGIYPPNIAADVSPERLRRFFVKTDDGRYQISRRIRDIAVFSTQNVCRDAPFSRLDFVSCRNVLIYLQPGIQKNVLRILHYSLLPEGFLMLGTSETVGESSELFTLIDRKNKIYSAKKVTLAHSAFDLGVGHSVARVQHDVAPLTSARPIISIANLADRKILEQYAPPGIVINENLDIVYFRGRTSPYLEQPSGVATHNALRQIRPELHPPLKKAIEHAFASSEAISVEAQVKDDVVGFRPLTLVVQPIQEPETRARCLLILFTEPSAKDGAVRMPPPPHADPDSTERARQLAQELALTKDYLQSTIEELERTNEDLKASNEELQSSNEELQSTNEELETSKEELQSTNEELITLNEELQNRMRDLGTANDDLHNVLLGADRPVIIVGLDLRIRRFTRSAEELLNLVSEDIGRSVSQLNAVLGGTMVEKMAADAIGSVSTVEGEVQINGNSRYLLRAVPYKTLDLTIRGAVITLIDMESLRSQRELTRAVDRYATEFLAAIQHPLVILDRDLSVVWVNDRYAGVFGPERDDIVGRPMSSVEVGAWTGPALVRVVAQTLATGIPFRDLEVPYDFQTGGKRLLRIGGSRIRGVAEDAVLALISIEGDFSNLAEGT